MWNPERQSRSALALAMAAAVAFLGSGAMLKAGSAVAHLTSGARADGRPGALLLAIVILLAATGGILIALAAKELLGHPEPHPASETPRRRR
jgi:hypothetical protein